MSYKLFKSTVESCRYVFKNGTVACFISGRYATDVKTEIEELDAEVALKHPTIYVDAKEKEVEQKAVDPIANLRKQIINDYLRDMGESPKADPRVGLVNSKTVADTSAASVSTSK